MPALVAAAAPSAAAAVREAALNCLGCIGFTHMDGCAAIVAAGGVECAAAAVLTLGGGGGGPDGPEGQALLRAGLDVLRNVTAIEEGRDALMQTPGLAGALYRIAANGGGRGDARAAGATLQAIHVAGGHATELAALGFVPSTGQGPGRPEPPPSCTPCASAPSVGSGLRSLCAPWM